MMNFYGTFGPACHSKDVMTRLFKVGMTGMRLNLSHVNLKECDSWLNAFHKAAKAEGITPELMADLRGPELRIRDLPKPLFLEEGDHVFLTHRHISQDTIPVDEEILETLEDGQRVFLNDGQVELKVFAMDLSKRSIACRVLRRGEVSSRKNMMLPGVILNLPTLTRGDLENIKAFKKYGVTQVMLPFVRHKEDLINLRNTLKAEGLEHIKIFAKIENIPGVEDLESLLPYADEVVIARGDLGNAVNLWDLPAIQKQIARKCKAAGKPFMIVTQLLHHMEAYAAPTRAEVCDIFNAVLDGATALMLTGETAVGEYPVEAMDYLVKTANAACAYKAQHP